MRRRLSWPNPLKPGDLKNYEIIIHSIKSTSATIGADVPCKLAQKLETAAKENDLDYVLSTHEAFLAGYNTVSMPSGLSLRIQENLMMTDLVTTA